VLKIAKYALIVGATPIALYMLYVAGLIVATIVGEATGWYRLPMCTIPQDCWGK
jgi:hypothetical protein